MEKWINELEKKVRKNAAEQQQQQKPLQEGEPSAEPKDQEVVTADPSEVNQQQPSPAETSSLPTEQRLEAEPSAHVEQPRDEEIQGTATSQTPTPPKRDKSPVKKRQASPSKDKRSPSPKKESNQRDKSPTKKDLNKRDKSPQKKTPGGVTLIVNGTEYCQSNTQTEPASPEPVTSNASITLEK